MSRSTKFYSASNWKPVYFPEKGWSYMTVRWELQAKV